MAGRIVVGGWVDFCKVVGICELRFGARCVGRSVIVRLGTTARLAAVWSVEGDRGVKSI